MRKHEEQMSDEDDTLEITIRNWDYYNPRKDVKRSSWFRFSHDFFNDPDFYGFTHAERLVWIYILCMASKKNSSQVKIHLNHAFGQCRIEKKHFDQALKKLESIQCVRVHVTSKLPVRISTNDTYGTYEKTIVDRTSTKHTFNLEILYQKYPRHEGKGAGLKKLKAQIKTEQDYQDLSRAIDRYAKHVHGKEPEFIKLFSTFVSHWRDWLDPDIGKTVRQLKPTLSMQEFHEEERKKRQQLEEKLHELGKI